MFKHTSISFLRHLPIWSAAAGTLLCLLLSLEQPLLSHYSIILYEVGVITCGFLIVYFFSVYLGYCIIQRLGIYYSYIVLLCVWLKRYPDGITGIFGSHLHHAHIVLAAVGISYVMLVLFVQRSRIFRCRSNQ